MSKKNVVLAVLTLAATALIGAAITALLLGHSEAFAVLRDLTILAAVAALVQIMKIFYEEIEALREERDDLHLFNHLLQQELERLREVEVNAELNREAFKEVSRDAREAWEEVERLRAELAKAEASAANGWKDAGEKWAQVTDLKAKVQDLEAWIASPPPTPEDIIW